MLPTAIAHNACQIPLLLIPLLICWLLTREHDVDPSPSLDLAACNFWHILYFANLSQRSCKCCPHIVQWIDQGTEVRIQWNRNRIPGLTALFWCHWAASTSRPCSCGECEWPRYCSMPQAEALRLATIECLLVLYRSALNNRLPLQILFGCHFSMAPLRHKD